MKKGQIIKGINSFLTIALAAVLIPLFLTIFFQKMRLEELSGGLDGTKEQRQSEELLIGIVAKEISVNAPKECILAQSVIARTNLFAAKESGGDIPAGLSVEEMHTLWGEAFLDNYERLAGAVEETDGQVLEYKNACIYAAYHAVSAGCTRDIRELYEDVDMPYLVTKECYEDCNAKQYLSVLYWEEEEFLRLCREQFKDAQINSAEEVAVLEKDSAGYVLQMQVGEKSYDGEEFRMAFGLNSANFTLAKEGENVRIVTKGVGHGFGLSQYTAERMAQSGSSYVEILNYFFPNTNLTDKRE